MTILRVQATLNPSSGLPKDGTTNVRYFEVSALRSEAEYIAVATSICDAWQAYFGDIFSFFSQLLDGTATYKAYNLDQPKPRTPIYVDTRTIGGVTAGNIMPAEVAVVTSFQANPLAGESQARRRGRNYLGPLKNTVIDASTGLVTTSYRTFVKNAELDFITAISNIVEPTTWGVVHAYDQPGQSISYVTNGWINDEPDTQRRRGRTQTTRTLWPGVA